MSVIILNNYSDTIYTYKFGHNISSYYLNTTYPHIYSEKQLNGVTSVKYFMDRSYLSVHWFPFPFTISTTVVTYHAWQLASAFPLHLFCHPIRIERPVLAAWAAVTWHYLWRILRGQTSLKKIFAKILLTL